MTHSTHGRNRPADVAEIGEFGRRISINAFQCKMAHWDRTHPFNAVHAVRLPGAARPDALRAAARSVCGEVGIGELVVSLVSIHDEPLRDVPVRVVAGGASAEQTLAELMSEEINQPFGPGPHHPLRWFLFDERDGGAHWIVVVYHHVIADAHSIAMLLGIVLGRYTDVAAMEGGRRLTLRSHAAKRWMWWQNWRNGCIRSAFWAARFAARVTRSHRIRPDAMGGDTARVLLRSTEPGFLTALQAACRAADAGLNDALVAGLAKSVAVQARRVGDWRSGARVAVATIMDLRRWAPADLSNYFGAILGEMILVVEGADGEFEEILRQVTQQRRRLSPEQHAAAATMSAFPAWTFQPVLGIKTTSRGCRLAFPLSGAVSTVRVNEALPGPVAAQVSRYVRAIPAGPATPLGLAPTIHAERLELGLTYRPVLRGIGDAGQLMDDVIETLAEFSRRA